MRAPVDDCARERSHPHANGIPQALKIRGNLIRRGNNPDLKTGAAVLERSAALFRERHPESGGRLGALFYLAQTLRSSNLPARRL